MKFVLYGDSAILVEFGKRINASINAKVHLLDELLNSNPPKGMIESVPAYASLTVFYDPVISTPEELIERMKKLWKEKKNFREELHRDNTIEIPVVYGGKYGPDLEFVASYNGLSSEEVIKIHTSREYPVYMVGFTPGFAYLGKVPKVISVPRLPNPRTKVAPGSVGIGGMQTGIYSIESPGGWRIIGRTPVKLFNVCKEPPVLLTPGMKVRFVAISEEEYESVKKIK